MKWRSFILLLFAIIHLQKLIAFPVGIDEIETIAQKFIAEYSYSAETFTIDSIISNGMNGLFYVIVLAPTGWIITSADDNIQPILAYSFDTPYINFSSWSDNLKSWINLYSLQIKYQLYQPDLVRNPQWDLLYFDKLQYVNKSVSPMIQVTWDQGSGWNQFCPVDQSGPGGHAYVGCVAVAMAQVMSYYAYPEEPRGSHAYSHPTYGPIFVNYDQAGPYNWEDMSLVLSDTMNAKFLYHCAVSVDMDFGSDGSGAITSRSLGAMVQYFRYPSGVMDYVQRYDNVEEWKVYLRTVLDNGYPMIYDGDAGDDQPGHTFNIDGYEGDFFHINWGWNGSLNGFFTINNLTPGTHDFTQNQHALVNIRPPVPGPKDISLSKYSVEEDLPVGSIVAIISVEDEMEDNVYTYSLNGPSIFEKNIETNFYLSYDTIKTLRVFDRSVQSEFPLHVYVTDQYENSLNKEFIITVTENGPSGHTNILDSQAELILYPNPTSGRIYFKNIPRLSVSGICLLRIYNTNGVLVNEMELYPSKKEIIEVKLSLKKAGIYSAVITTGDQVIVKQFIFK
jgi:hypothetical protein